MKKAMITISVLLVSILVANTGAKIEMRNGDVIECEISMESISFITDYGELKIPVSFVREIVFPAPGNRVTTLNTVFPNETFGGFLLDEYISVSLLGNPMRLHKDAISEITAYNEDKAINQELVQVHLKTGDQFYGEMLSTGVKIQTSYGEFNISTEDIEGMEFEGEGNILTKIRLKNSSEIRGTIKDDFIVFKLLSGSELSVSPGKIRSILFLKRTESGVVEVPHSNNLKSAGNMVLVERGSFTMYSTNSGQVIDSEDANEITLTYDFYMGKYEVTFDEYDAFCIALGKGRPSDNGWGRQERPVSYVSWWDAIAYCNWLSNEEGLPIAYNEKGEMLDQYGVLTADPSEVIGYRLPTEAEWLYAANGGINKDVYRFSGSNDADEVAWFRDNSNGETHAVGSKLSNSLGIYDMSGNVPEWCSDYYDPNSYRDFAKINPFVYEGISARVYRGGGYYDSLDSIVIATRVYGAGPDEGQNAQGFRICRTVP